MNEGCISLEGGGDRKPLECRDSKAPCPCEMRKLLIGAVCASCTDRSMRCLSEAAQRQPFIKSDTRELIQLMAITLSLSPFPLNNHCSLIFPTFMSKFSLGREASSDCRLNYDCIVGQDPGHSLRGYGRNEWVGGGITDGHTYTFTERKQRKDRRPCQILLHLQRKEGFES